MKVNEIASLTEISRRGFLTGLAAFAAVSAMPPGVVKALSTPDGIQGLSVSDVSGLLKAIRAYLPPYDQEDWTGTFERWDDMAAALRIYGDDNDVGADKLDRLLRLYRRNPESASTKLLNHLKKHAVDLTDVQGKTIDQWDDVATVRKSDEERSEWRQLQQQFADYFAKQDKQPSISQAQTVATAATGFRDLVQRVIDAGQTAAAAPPREKYMGRIDPTASAPALPAPDRSAADIMRDLQARLDRSLTDQEREIVQQELLKSDEYHRTGMNEESGQDYPAWRIRFTKFRKIPPVLPEREGKVYLMPADQSALKTFYSLTGKDFTKINNMPTEAYMVSGNAMVGNMHTINYLLNAIKELKHWRSAWTPESVEKREKYIEELKQEYLNEMVPLSQYRPGQFSMPEILAEPSQIRPIPRSVIYDKNTGDIVLRPKAGTSAELNEGLRDTLAGLALGAGVAMSGAAEAKIEKVVVSPGQTVYSIAKAFDTTPQVIQKLNRLDRSFSIRPGQTLLVPGGEYTDIIKQPAPKPAVKQAQPAVKQDQPAKLQTLTGTTAEAIAKRLALRQGLKGLELAAFLAQIKHESWDFKRMHEVGDKRYFQRMYDKKYKPAKAKGLGNTEPGDGVRYRGRGYMQLTGRDNYRRVGRLLGIDLENNPELAARPDIAAKVALLYWKKRVRPNVKDWSNVAEVTKPINSKLSHLEDRKRDFAAYVDFYKLGDQI